MLVEAAAIDPPAAAGDKGSMKRKGMGDADPDGTISGEAPAKVVNDPAAGKIN